MGRSARGRGLLLALLLVQAGIGLYQHGVFFDQLFRFGTRFARHGAGAGSSLLLVAAIAGVAALWAVALPGRTFSERLGAAGLALVAALGLAHTFAALLTGGRLHPSVTWSVVAAAGLAGAALLLRRGGRVAGAASTSFRPWDLASAFFLLTLLVPGVFPYIHYDAYMIWAGRAYAFAEKGSLGAILAIKCPNYPPLYSILLWLGIEDSLFEGRLLPWLVLVLFCLFLRARLEALVGTWAPPVLLFFVSTVHVWQGTAMYYANVPLMVFLTAGALLAWGLPRCEATRAERAAGALCLSAAVLIRPDGLYYLGVLGVAWGVARWRWSRPLTGLPLAAAALSALAWGARPAALRVPHDFFSAASEGWRAAGPTPLRAAGNALATFLDGLQGQWIAHKGFGVAFLLLLAALAVRSRRRAPADDTTFFGLVTLGSLAAVALCYLAIGFFGDPVEGAQPFAGTWRESYLHFIRVGLGRMTVHLYPFALLYGAGAFAPDAGVVRN